MDRPGRRAARAAARRGPARRRRRLSRAARAVRRGRHGAGAARAARRALRRRGRARLVAVHGQAGLQGRAGGGRRAAGRLRRRERGAPAHGPGRRARRAGRARAAAVRQARPARLVGRHRAGGGARGARRRPGRGLRPRRARDRRGVLPRPGGRVRGHGPGRARRPPCPGEIVLLKGAGWYDFEAKYAEGGMELRVPARLAPATEDAGPAARRRDLRAGRLHRARAGGLLRRGRRAGAGQRAQHAARHDADERVPQAVGGQRRAVARDLRPPAAAGRWSATRASGRAGVSDWRKRRDGHAKRSSNVVARPGARDGTAMRSGRPTSLRGLNQRSRAPDVALERRWWPRARPPRAIAACRSHRSAGPARAVP